MTCATISRGEEAGIARTGSHDVLVAGGIGSGGASLILFSIADDTRVFLAYPFPSPPISVCCAIFNGAQKILVGAGDGCVRSLGAGVPFASDSSESLGSDPSHAPELGQVWYVSVMPIAGLVVAGHKGGWFSLRRVESGAFAHAFRDARGDSVECVDISADEGMVVSGHYSRTILVWDPSTWECRFQLEGHSAPVGFAKISSDTKRIMTLDWGGELCFWDAVSGGEALWTIDTGLHFSGVGTRGAMSLDEESFLWATRGQSVEVEGDLNSFDDRNWYCKMIDFGSWSVFFDSRLEPTPLSSDWDEFMGDEDMDWKFGAVRDRFVELRDVGSDQSVDIWRFSSGTEDGDFTSRIDCLLRPAKGALPRAGASLHFDRVVVMIAAAWMPGEVDGRRCAVVACELRRKSRPAIMHFYLPKTNGYTMCV